MATKLEKDVIRESTVKSKDREIMVTLSANQRVSLKLKGMKSGEESIGIEELYNQLTNGGEGETPSKVVKKSKPSKSNPSINLHDLRAHNAIADMDYEVKSKFDQIIKNLIDSNK
jgi:hypothetical protein